MSAQSLCLETGSVLWPVTYRHHLSFDDMRNVANRVLLLTGSPRSASGLADSDAIMFAVGCAGWVNGGCRMLCPSNAAFGAFAMTSINSDALKEMRIPWPTFAMRIPHVESDGQRFSMALFSQFEGVTLLDRTTREPKTGTHVRMDILGDDAAGYVLHRELSGDISLSDLFSVKSDSWSDEAHFRSQPLSDHEESFQNLVLRACFGCLFTMQHTKNWRLSADRAGRRLKDLRDSPPPHRNIVIGSPIRIDLMPTVRDIANGNRHNAPAVQTLVRGHYKRQVIGIGRAGRKVIWVEPYWRGPEDAPILARPYRIDEAAAS